MSCPHTTSIDPGKRAAPCSQCAGAPVTRVPSPSPRIYSEAERKRLDGIIRTVVRGGRSYDDESSAPRRGPKVTAEQEVAWRRAGDPHGFEGSRARVAPASRVEPEIEPEAPPHEAAPEPSPVAVERRRRKADAKPPEAPSGYISMRDAATMIGWKRNSIQAALSHGQFPHVKVGRHRFVEIAALEAFRATRRPCRVLTKLISAAGDYRVADTAREVGAGGPISDEPGAA